MREPTKEALVDLFEIQKWGDRRAAPIPTHNNSLALIGQGNPALRRAKTRGGGN